MKVVRIDDFYETFEGAIQHLKPGESAIDDELV